MTGLFDRLAVSAAGGRPADAGGAVPVATPRPAARFATAAGAPAGAGGPLEAVDEEVAASAAPDRWGTAVTGVEGAPTAEHDRPSGASNGDPTGPRNGRRGGDPARDASRVAPSAAGRDPHGQATHERGSAPAHDPVQQVTAATPGTAEPGTEAARGDAPAPGVGPDASLEAAVAVDGGARTARAVGGADDRDTGGHDRADETPDQGTGRLSGDGPVAVRAAPAPSVDVPPHGRPPAGVDAPAVVTVHIGRVDVRLPAPRPAPAPDADAGRTADDTTGSAVVELGAYLDGGRGRR